MVVTLFRRYYIRCGLIFFLLAVTPVFSEVGLTLAQLKTRAADSLAKERLTEAAELYRQWTQREPRRSEAFLGLGESLLRMGYSDRARGAFLRASQLRPDLVDAKIGMANTFLLNGEADRAYSVLDEVRKKDAGNVNMNLAFASYYQLMHRNDLRRSFLEKILRQNPTVLAAILELAVLSAEEGNVTDAEKQLERAALVAPDSLSLFKKRAQIHYRLGLLKYGRKQLEKAGYYYRMYLNGAGNDPSAISDLIQVEYMLGRPDRANELMQRLDKSEIYRRPILNANIAEALISKTNDTKALVDALEIGCNQMLLPLSCFRYEQAIVKYDQNNSMQSRRIRRMKDRQALAKQRLLRNRSDAFDFHLKQALVLNPDDIGLHIQRLEQYRKAGAYEDYLRSLTYVRSKQPNEARWNTRLTEALRHRREYLPYRIGLDESDYGRRPAKIMVFDLRPDQNTIEHYQEPALVSDFISVVLKSTEKWQLSDDVARLGLKQRLTNDLSFLFYDATVPATLSAMGEHDIDALLEGSYDLRPSSIRIRLTLRNLDGIQLGTFSDSASVNDVDLLGMKVANFIDQILALKATIIDVDHLILNVGTVDGVKKEELFRSVKNPDLIVKVDEVSRYVSRISLVKGSLHQLSKGMLLQRVVRK